jgi:transglutaminase-like putative cysteine protease
VAIAWPAVNSRFLAFLAITSAIAAVAWVSRDPLMLGVGVAGLAVGNIYMWRTHYAPSRVRTAVLLLLLLLLLFYLARDMLFSLRNDPVLLARYLVFGLIVSSFDLVTRRNVLGNVVLAGMLLVLLSPMAFGLWFPLLLALFMVLALSAAIRGHAEEESNQAMVVGGGVRAAGVVALGGLLLGFLALAGALFLLMPRFGFGGLGAATWLPSRIDLTAGGPAQLPSRPSASVSADILVPTQSGDGAFGRYARLGFAGSAADVAVLHVRSPVPSYWRGSLLDQYDGVGWLPSAFRLTLTDEGRGEFVFSDSDRSPVSSEWYAQTYYLMGDQPYAFFTGYNPGRLYLPDSAQTFLQKGTVYRAISPLPRLTAQGLRRDRVDTGDLVHLALPPITGRTAALADSIVREAVADYDKAARLEQFLLRNYRYDLRVEPLAPGRDAVDTFLFEAQAGYCAQFATAMAVMARHVGLPARVAVGYLPGVYDPMTGAYRVRAGDAHAWVEIHFRISGWVAFDPTPGLDVAQGPAGDQRWVSFGLTDFAGANFTGALSSLVSDRFSGFPSLSLWPWLALLVLGIAVGITIALLLAKRRASARHSVRTYTLLVGEPRAAVLRAYGQMVTLLGRHGLPTRLPSQAPGEYARLVVPQLAAGREQVEWLAQAANAAAYDPRPLSPSLGGEAKQRLATLASALSGSGRRAF